MSDVQKPAGISRRSVAKGMAWSVPAVAVASAAPAFAASGGGPTLQFVSACKNPGNSCKTRPKGYSFFYNVCNNTGKTIYIYGVSISSATTNLTFDYSVPAVPFAVATGTCVPVEFVADSTNSANQPFTATVCVKWGHNPTPPDPDNHPDVCQNVNVPGTPPDCTCPSA
jgi:hypothetical protein